MAKAFERKLEADSEQQKNDPHLRKRLNRMDFLDQAQAKGTGQRPGREQAGHRGQAQPAQQDGDYRTKSRYDGHLLKQRDVVHVLIPNARGLSFGFSCRSEPQEHPADHAGQYRSGNNSQF